MTVDYDLIILGGAAVGRYGATQASQLGARVALIEPPDQALNPRSLLFYPALMQLNRSLRQQRWLGDWWMDGQCPVQYPVRHLVQQGTPAEQIGGLDKKQFPNWQRFRQQIDTLATTLEESSPEQSLSRLAMQGVEIITAPGTFVQAARLGFSVGNRLLRARRYLLTPSRRIHAPDIPGLSTVQTSTLEAWDDLDWNQIPARLLILGTDPRGIVLAQVLNRLGTQVTLITLSDRLLPAEDREVALLLQAQLEAEGVAILTQTQVTQVKQIGEQFWVQAGNQAISTDQILLALPPQLDLSWLNLESTGVKWQPQRILVNRQLQTTHPRIYACGEGLGSYADAAIDRYEVDIALHNALLFPNRSVDYRTVPTALFTDPEWVRLGMSEAQARARYGAAVQVVRQSLPVTKAQLMGEAGLLKLIVLPSGEILGVHGFGIEISEGIGTLALAMGQAIKLPALANLPQLSPTLAEALTQAAHHWRIQHRSPWQRELWETWFNFSRSR